MVRCAGHDAASVAGAVSRDDSVGNDGRDDVVVDAAEALTLNQDVQWDRCARLATPAGRRSLDVLRVVARVRDAFHAGADAPTGSSAATAAEPSAGVWVRRAACAIVAIKILPGMKMTGSMRAARAARSCSST